MPRVLTDEPLLVFGLVLLLFFFAAGFAQEKRHHHEMRARGSGYRHVIYLRFHLTMWGLAALVLLLWTGSGRSVQEIGLGPVAEGPAGMQAWVLSGIGSAYFLISAVRVAFSREARRRAVRQLQGGGDYTLLQPETPWQRRHFYLVAWTAGFCEEVVFRGFLIGVLALFLPLVWAAYVAAAVFVLGHSYQGPRGMIRILPITAVLTMLFVFSGSLWPGIVLHTVVDAAGGVILYFAGTDAARARAAR